MEDILNHFVLYSSILKRFCHIDRMQEGEMTKSVHVSMVGAVCKRTTPSKMEVYSDRVCKRKGRKENERIRICMMGMQGLRFMETSVMAIPYREFLETGVKYKSFDR